MLKTPGGTVGLVLTLGLIALALLANTLAPADPFASVAQLLSPPSRGHAFGTDDLGRDVLTGIIHGARTSLPVAASVTVLAALIGIAVGALASFRVGVVDDVLMRVTEFVLIVPRFFSPSSSSHCSARDGSAHPGTRSHIVAGNRSRGARADGIASPPRVRRRRACSRRHRHPRTAPLCATRSSPRGARGDLHKCGGVILLEAGLSFIGLGDPSRMSWGYLANNAQRLLRVAWWVALFPGAAIALAVLGLNLLSDALSDLLDPGAPRPT